MRYIASAIFFGVWAYLLHFLYPRAFVLFFKPDLFPSANIDDFAVSGVWMLLPFGLGAYLFITAEQDRLAAKRNSKD